MDLIREEIIEFNMLGDERGQLIAIESGKDIPFEIKRIFYIYGMDSNAIRGQHANKKSEFVLINLAGQCKVRVDNGKGSESVIELNKPNKGLYIPKLVWKDMYDFSNGAVLLCLSNELYDGTEYIRDYNEFVKYVNEK